MKPETCQPSLPLASVDQESSSLKEGEIADKPKKRRSGAHKEQGVAILLVLASLAVLLPITASFSYQSRVDWQSAVNLRDEIAARNLHRGALRLSVLLFELQRMVFSQQQFRDAMGTWDITQVAPHLMAIFGSSEGAEEMEGLASLAGLDGFDSSVFQELAIENGSFEVRLEAESGKLNVNCLAQPNSSKNKTQARVVETLEAMLAPTLYNPLFEEEQTDGHRYTRGEVIQALVDYIDDDNKNYDLVKFASGSGNENYRYQELADPYEARNARLDSVDEVHLAAGMNDDMMMAIGSELTVYGGCKVNLNFASADQIALVLRHSVSSEDKWKTQGEEFLLKTMPLAYYIVEQRQFSLFDDIKAFQELAAKPDQFISPLLLAMSGDDEDMQANPNMPLIPEGIKVELRSGSDAETNESWGGLQDVATVAPERVYRVEIISHVGAVKKRLTAVYDMQYARSQSKGKGAWVYYRED